MQTRILVSLPLFIAITIGANSPAHAGDTGACCLFDRECEYLTEAQCNQEGGKYLGDGTSCDDCPVDGCGFGIDEKECTVMPADALNGLVLCPALPTPIPATQLSLVIRNSCPDPVANATVSVTLTDSNPLCPGVVLSGQTNAAGEVTLTLAGGGCRHGQPLAAVIRANGFTVRQYRNVKSPDFDGVGSNGRVDLADLVYFKEEFLDRTSGLCHDYNNDGDVTLGDLIIFAPAYSQANHCP